VKYVPSIKVPSDDFVITDEEDAEHRPHEGEWVRFKRQLPYAMVKLIWGSQDLANLDDDERFRLRMDRGEEIVQALARQILDWSWTDEHGEPLPKPSERKLFLDILRWLSPDEVSWLMGHVMDGAAPEKNS